MPSYRSDDEDTSNCPKPSQVVDSRRCPRCDRRKTGVNAAAVGDEERSRWLLRLRDGLDVSLATVANLIRKTEAAEEAAKNAGRTVVLVVQDGDVDDDDDGCCGCCRPGAGGAGPLTLSSRQSVDKQCEHSPLPPSPLTSSPLPPSPLPPSPCLCSGPADVASAKVAAPTKAASAKVADARLPPTRASGAFRSKSWCCTGGPSVVAERLTALTDLTPEGCAAEREWCADCGTDNDDDGDDHGGGPRCHWVAAGAVARSTSDDGTRRARPDRPKRARPINWIEVNKRRVSCHSGKRAPPGKRQKAPVPRPLPRPLW